MPAVVQVFVPLNVLDGKRVVSLTLNELAPVVRTVPAGIVNAPSTLAQFLRVTVPVALSPIFFCPVAGTFVLSVLLMSFFVAGTFPASASKDVNAVFAFSY